MWSSVLAEGLLDCPPLTLKFSVGDVCFLSQLQVLQEQAVPQVPLLQGCAWYVLSPCFLFQSVTLQWDHVQVTSRSPLWTELSQWAAVSPAAY